MTRTIRVGSWVIWKPSERRKYKLEVLRVHADGAIDITDPRTGNLRTVAADSVRPANRPRSLR